MAITRARPFRGAELPMARAPLGLDASLQHLEPIEGRQAHLDRFLRPRPRGDDPETVGVGVDRPERGGPVGARALGKAPGVDDEDEIEGQVEHGEGGQHGDDRPVLGLEGH